MAGRSVIANVADLVDRMQELENNKSHIGMIIESVELDTMEKVIAIYGGITWTRIEGKMLLGTSSNHNINETGGNDYVSYTPLGSVGDTTLTTSQIPQHLHLYNTTSGPAPSGQCTVPSSQYGGGYDGRICIDYTTKSSTSAGGGGSHNHSFTGTTSTISTLPPYTTVYIWKRTA